MKNIFLLMFLLHINSFSQNIKTNYIISFCGRPQTLHLTQYENGEIKGFLETKLWKKRNLNSRKSKDMIFRNNLPDSQSEKLYNQLKNAEIDSLNDCDKSAEKLAFLDADYFTIAIESNNYNQHKSFAEIYPLSQTHGKVEKNCLRRKIQHIATLIDEEINMKNQFSELIKKQGKGVYCYFSGISILCIKKEKKYNKDY